MRYNCIPIFYYYKMLHICEILRITLIYLN